MLPRGWVWNFTQPRQLYYSVGYDRKGEKPIRPLSPTAGSCGRGAGARAKKRRLSPSRAFRLIMTIGTEGGSLAFKGIPSGSQAMVSHDGNGRNGQKDIDVAETSEWLDALESVLQTTGRDRARFLLEELEQKASRSGVE